MAEKTTKELERIYTIPLRTVKDSPRNHRTDRAIRFIRSYLVKHMKAKDVWIDGSVNEQIWSRGMYNLQSRIRVRALKFDDGVVEVTLPEAEVTDSVRAALAKRREEAAEEKEKEKKEEAAKEKDKKKEEAEGDKKTEAGEEKKEGEPKPEKPEAEKPAAPAKESEAKPKPKAAKDTGSAAAKATKSGAGHAKKSGGKS